MRLNDDQIFKVHIAFSATKYGQILNERPRFKKYMPDSLSLEKWTELIGPDANSLVHLTETYLKVKDFIVKFEKADIPITDEDYNLMCLFAVIHDWGKAIMGDIESGIMNHDNRQAELESLTKVKKEIEIEAETRLLAGKAINKIFVREDTNLFKLYDSIDRTIYLDTAKKAWHSSITSREYGLYLKAMCAYVLFKQIPELAVYAKKFLPIREYFLENKPLLNEMFYNMTDKAFTVYPREEAEQFRHEFLKTKVLWMNGLI